MSKTLRVLIVEDSEDDAALVRRVLEKGGYELVWERVDTAPAMKGALLRHPWDVVISDHSMPHFSAPAALKLLESSELDLPFLIVSGSIGEDVAVAAMRAGAHDFLLKSNLARLVPAVQRECREAARRGEHRRAEAALRGAEERYRRFFEDDLTSAVLATPEGRIVDCNPAFLSTFAFDAREEALGASLKDLYRHAGPPADLLERAAREDRVAGYEAAWVRRDGRLVHVVANAVSEPGTSGAIERVRVYLFDVTRRKELEEQVRQSQKMEAVGRLAGGVAHDFNNLLTAIQGYAEMSLSHTREGDAVRRHAGEIKRACEKATLLTRQLLAFSRKQILQSEVLDLGEVVGESEGLFRRLIGEDVEVRLALDPAARPVRADRGQLHQVILNLVVNARDAMPRGGRLSIEVAPAEIAAGATGQDRGVPPGRYTRLAVTDTGVGMGPDTLAHLFEPFFTTKERGKGTGLGLATVHGIVAQSGGHVRYSTTLGKGTTFRVYLPVVDGVVSHESAPPAAAPTGQGGDETILVVEDDEMVRAILVDQLTEHGYHVLAARDGAEAVGYAETHEGKIDLLLTDVVMPKMGGVDVARFVRKNRPDVPVLFVSGYADEAVGGQGALPVDAQFLAKPFTWDELARKVREVLGPRPPGRPRA